MIGFHLKIRLFPGSRLYALIWGVPRCEWMDGDNHIISYLLARSCNYINLPCNPKILNWQWKIQYWHMHWPSQLFGISVAGSTLPPLSPAAFLQHERLMTGLLVLVPNSESQNMGHDMTVKWVPCEKSWAKHGVMEKSWNVIENQGKKRSL